MKRFSYLLTVFMIIGLLFPIFSEKAFASDEIEISEISESVTEGVIYQETEAVTDENVEFSTEPENTAETDALLISETEIRVYAEKTDGASPEKQDETSTTLEEVPKATKITLNLTKVTLGVGETTTLKAVTDVPQSGETVVFSSSDENFVSVSQNGKITAVAKGKATVYARVSKGVYAKCIVTVLPAPQKVTLNKTNLTLGVGESFNFNSSIPSGTASYYKKFASDSPVLTYKGSGVFKAEKKGTATVSVTLFNGKKATCKVTVLPAAQKVTLNKTTLTLGVGESFNFNSYVPEGTASNVRSFASSTGILTYKGNGVFKAEKKGTSTVSVTLFNGKKATCKVTVLPAAQKVTLNKTTLTLGVGESFNFNSYVPEGTASNVRSFASSTGILTYKGKGVFKAEKKGTSTVSVTLFNGKKATCKVTVLPAPKKVTLNKTKLTLGIGESFKFRYTLPSGTASYQKKYTNSDSTVLKYNGSGKFTARKAGTAVVKIVLFNGKYASCTVTVKPLPGYIYSASSEYTMQIGSTKKAAIRFPQDTGCNGLSYKSSNKNNAYCDENGVIHAKREGSATITVTSFNKKTCTFKVKVTKMNVPFVSQLPKYPTGCEAASCVELLRYYGYSITLDEMIDLIPRKKLYYKNGKRYGPDINKYFVGDPRGKYASDNPGYGAFSPCVTKALQKAVDERGGKHKATKITGCSFKTLLSHISAGRPAIVWATYKMKVPTEMNSWYITETGKYFEYPRGSHVMVLAGYSDSTVTIIDPYDGICRYNIETFEKRWNLLGKQAIVLK